VPLNSLGIDSLTASEIKNRIESDLQVTISIVKFLDGNSISDFADLILTDLEQGPVDPPAQSPAIEPDIPKSAPMPGIDPQISSQVQSMSEKQIDDMLRKLMSQGSAR
jgi:hypothetical protein